MDLMQKLARNVAETSYEKLPPDAVLAAKTNLCGTGVVNQRLQSMFSAASCLFHMQRFSTAVPPMRQTTTAESYFTI